MVSQRKAWTDAAKRSAGHNLTQHLGPTVPAGLVQVVSNGDLSPTLQSIAAVQFRPMQMLTPLMVTGVMEVQHSSVLIPGRVMPGIVTLKLCMMSGPLHSKAVADAPPTALIVAREAMSSLKLNMIMKKLEQSKARCDLVGQQQMKRSSPFMRRPVQVCGGLFSLS
ncbi:hypothetical protein BC834DRAFT_862244 [Gloeopeniophorella convolvens]|nr:hypothetical protein BC834DRAFT_862244 [Gloeopeniophorella convolvens]